MTTVAMTQEQQARLQGDVQRELEKREWAEPGDNVMAEYVTVLVANGSSKDRVKAEMEDLVGSDFDSGFLDWLFDTASQIQRVTETPKAPSPAQGGSRMLNSALTSTREDNKRKAESDRENANKKRMSDTPSAPRAMGNEGRALQDRLSGRPRGLPMQVRGAARPMNQPNFRPAMMPGFGGFFPPQMQAQQEMMAQMMMMQANMAQMGDMMARMVDERDKKEPVAGYATEGAKPKKSVAKPAPKPPAIPDKPTSKALCKYSVGCSNARCPFSHPSPVADQKTGMVLSDEACEAGKNCKDPECIKSHVSPAVTGNTGKLLCKYQNCTNPTCSFRHEDADGNAIPPPALSKPKTEAKPDPSSDNEDDLEVVVTSKNLMDGALDDTKAATICRYGERCTRPDCKFIHPASRPTPRGRGSVRGKRGAGRSSMKSELDAKASEFVPQQPVS